MLRSARNDELLLGILPKSLAQRDITLLLRGPVAATGDGAVDHQLMAIDKTGFVAGKEQRGIGDVVSEAGTLDRLRGLVDSEHHIGGLLRRVDRQAERLADDPGGDRARRDRI